MTQATPLARPLTGLARPAIVSAVFFLLLTGLAYPALTTLAANALFPAQAQGSLITRDGQPVGSAVIGQSFTRADYFHSRPSMTQGTDPADARKSIAQPYNGGLSGASNQGPTHQGLLDDVKARAVAYRRANGLAASALVPVDAVTASASGLDPEISVANARLQTPRVAAQRALTPAQVLRMVEAHTAGRTFGLLGEPRVNVLRLNLALDAQAPAAAPSASGPAAAR